MEAPGPQAIKENPGPDQPGVLYFYHHARMD